MVVSKEMCIMFVVKDENEIVTIDLIGVINVNHFEPYVKVKEVYS